MPPASSVLPVLALDLDLDTVNPADEQTLLIPMVWLFAAVLVTFVATRLVTRSIRHRSDRGDPAGGIVSDISIGGVHVHHAVPGIVLMAVAGVGLVATTPSGVALSAWAVVLGVGLSLAFDEFALWLHLDDVYWSETGRVSVDAVFCITAISGILLFGTPLLPGEVGSGIWLGAVAVLAWDLVLAGVCLAKGKPITALVGVFLSPLLYVGCLRLAKPTSWWARRRYADRPRRLARAEKRFGPAYTERWNRRRDLVAGSPTAAPAPGASATPR